MQLSPVYRTICFLLLGICLLVLTKYILFKKSPRYYKNYFNHGYKRYSAKEGWEKANTVPFKTIRLMQGNHVSSEYRVDNIGGNIIGFIPLGFLLSLLFPGLRRYGRSVLAVFVISLVFETTQLLTGVGIFDIDDLLLNTTGGLIGYLLFLMTIQRFLRTAKA